MASEVLVRGLLYLSLAVVGVPGNAAVIWAFLLLLHQERRLLPADAIVLHLACANLLVVGVRCPLETLASFGLEVFDDAGCKGVIFIYRTGRSLSIWLTFALSAYQCLSVAPPGSRWESARRLTGRHLGLVFLALWLVNTSMSSAAIAFSVASRNDSDSAAPHGINVHFCYVHFPSGRSKRANGAAQVTRDAVPMALMTLASLIILVFLYRHGRQVRGLGGGGGGAERRAAKGVVTLVVVYVLLYGVDNGLWVYTLTVRRTMASSLISDLRIFFTSLYAAISPLVVVASNRKVNRRLRGRGWGRETAPQE